MPMPTPEPLCKEPSFSSPSFSSYTSETIAQIAARVIQELHLDSVLNDADHEPNDEFEFAFVSNDPHRSPVSADDVFREGKIIPKFPLSDPAPAENETETETETETAPLPRRLPLRKLMLETEGTSAFGDDELTGVAKGPYCVWAPPPPIKKSSSSKRWKVLDLLHRSQSEGRKKELVGLLGSEKRSSGDNGGANDGCRLKKKLSLLPHRQRRWVV